MPDWVRELFNIGVTGSVTAGAAWLIWYKIIPWSERYIASTEVLHKEIAKVMHEQGDRCEEHGEAIEVNKRHLIRHDNVVRTACAMCRDVAAEHYPKASATVNRHCSEIERIIGEA